MRPSGGRLLPTRPPPSTAAALALHLAIEAAGSLDTDAVRTALRDMDVDTFYGPINFDATGKNVAKPMGTIQIQDGVARLVAPADVSVADLIYPARQVGRTGKNPPGRPLAGRIPGTARGVIRLPRCPGEWRSG